MTFDSMEEEKDAPLREPADRARSPRFTEEERQGVYRAIYERRDIRSYRPDPVEGDLLLRILDAAHHAPSVGFMQPWNFILIENSAIRRNLYDHFLEVNRKAASYYEGDRLRHYQSLKLQGLLDAPHLILVTCDTTRGGTHVLGRATIPDTDLYSTCLAIENLWLAARSEGVGVGWMSLYEPERVANELSLPEGVVPVALLTIGYAVEYPLEPLLASTGWRQRLPLKDVIFYDRWEGAARSQPHRPLHESAPAPAREDARDTPIRKNGGSAEDRMTQPLLAETVEKSRKRNLNLTKPPASLGRLEEIMLQLAEIQNRVHPSFANKQILLFAGDHGISSERVSAYRKELTAKMVYQYIAGGGAINVFCRQNNIRLSIIDVGVDHDFSEASGLIGRKVRRSTRNFLETEAMTPEELQAAMEVGRSMVRSLSDSSIVGVGEMGIGNSTSAAAITAAALGLDAELVCGRGTGIGDATRNRKLEVIRRALEVHSPRIAAPLDLLRIFGGYEIAAITGAILEAYIRRIPIVLDGFITTVSALIACRIEPGCRRILLAGHLSKEPGHAVLLQAMELKPILDLSMGLGEGTGAALAMGLIESAARIQSEMRTFEEAGIENPLDEEGRL